MSRNTNSRFALNPTNLNISRSKFNRDSTYKTSFNVGELIPFYVDEVLPGDTHQIRTSKLCRMQPLVTAPMDNLYLDTYYFFVPNRLVWNHWREFNGENTESAWIPKTEYAIPQVNAPASGWSVGTIADYMGIPTGVKNLSVSAIPFRAYALIVDEWFRDQNLQNPVNIPLDDATITGSDGTDYITDLVKGGKPFVAAKYHDYFTSCLPSPQKGPDVTIGMVSTDGSSTIPVKPVTDSPWSFSGGSDYPLKFGFLGNITVPSQRGGLVAFLNDSDSASKDVTAHIQSQQNVLPTNLTAQISSTNLGLDVSDASIATVNQLRMAFQIQKLYERDARGGTRYIEILKSHFGVTSPDARQQRPEYLGGNRIPINMNQVIQTSGSTDTSPQANVAGYSLTSDSHGDFIRSFTEHGYIIGLMVARYDHTYQQGLARHWSRKTRFDYYWPVLANIGEQAVLNKEIYAQGTEQDSEVFGYQEAWADYRYKPSMVTGEMRSQYAQSLDSWHFADDYEALPKLSPDWIKEDKTNIDRVLAVTSQNSNQLFADLFIQNETTRPMPMYSVPGLIDHN